ncbi:MAG TPA: DUF378 domain-containing protein [Bacteroidota bacterium]|nr:DUF378 domain-containing protein [Bacteroidota bacterium]
MKSMNVLIAILLVVGGLNWGLVGFLNFDLVATLFGQMSTLSRIVYALVGISAMYYVIAWKSIQGQKTTTK